MKIAIIGGSAAGLFASLLLARAGHEVLVLEQDHLAPANDVESAAACAFRHSAPHIVQPHAIYARGRQLLRERLPDVYQALLDAGVVEAPLAAQMPASLADHSVLPGDECLTALMTRRSTVDWVLRRIALAEPGVTVWHGQRVTALCAVQGDPPRVTGVRTEQADCAADLVIDASGRRSPIDLWLANIGARPTATWWAECGLAYFSRQYRVRSGATLPGTLTTRIMAGLDEFTLGMWGGDRGVMQVVIAPLDRDHRFRTVRDPEVFTAVLRTVPLFAPWLEVLDPISQVFPMAGLHNTLRRLVVCGEPVATGLLALGDSVCTTNPTLGRGVSLALWGATDLVEILHQEGDNWTAVALAMDQRAAEHVVPFYEDQAVIDSARLATLRHTIFGAPAPVALTSNSDRVTFAQLRAAAQYDPIAFRAFWKVMGMVCQPNEVYTDPPVVAATNIVLERHGSLLATPQPGRARLAAALARDAKPASGG